MSHYNIISSSTRKSSKEIELCKITLFSLKVHVILNSSGASIIGIQIFYVPNITMI